MEYNIEKIKNSIARTLVMEGDRMAGRKLLNCELNIVFEITSDGKGYNFAELIVHNVSDIEYLSGNAEYICCLLNSELSDYGEYCNRLQVMGGLERYLEVMAFRDELPTMKDPIPRKYRDCFDEEDRAFIRFT